FDCVCAFTAWHWLDPATRDQRAVALLRPGGALAVVETAHVVPADGDPFFVEVQEDYRAVLGPDEGADGPPGRGEDVGSELADGLSASRRFEHVAVRRHGWNVEYGADAYVDVLLTYSNHR